MILKGWVGVKFKPACEENQRRQRNNRRQDNREKNRRQDQQTNQHMEHMEHMEHKTNKPTNTWNTRRSDQQTNQHMEHKKTRPTNQPTHGTQEDKTNKPTNTWNTRTQDQQTNQQRRQDQQTKQHMEQKMTGSKSQNCGEAGVGVMNEDSWDIMLGWKIHWNTPRIIITGNTGIMRINHTENDFEMNRNSFYSVIISYNTCTNKDERNDFERVGGGQIQTIMWREPQKTMEQQKRRQHREKQKTRPTNQPTYLNQFKS